MNEESRQAAPDPFAYYDRLRRLRGFVDQHYAEAITASTAAKVVGLAEKYFSTFFHQKVGTTFGAWLRQYRIAKAKELLWSRNLTVSQVAERVGFRDLSTFIRAFKKRENLTPSAYKKLVRPS
jgi:AraC-like DNA-binding protein